MIAGPFVPPVVRLVRERWQFVCPVCRDRDSGYLTQQRARAAYRAHCLRLGHGEAGR